MAVNVPTIFVYMPAASATWVCTSGNIYISDTRRLIYNPTPTDVSSLVALFGGIVLNQRNQVSTSAPSVNNDLTQLFGIGSQWFNSTTNTLYICLDATTGAAVWLALVNSVPSITYAQPTSGATLTASLGQGGYQIDPAGNLAALNAILPPSPTNDQVFYISTTKVITAFVVTAPGGATVVGGGSAMLSGGMAFAYRTADTTWRRRY